MLSFQGESNGGRARRNSLDLVMRHASSCGRRRSSGTMPLSCHGTRRGRLVRLDKAKNYHFDRQDARAQAITQSLRHTHTPGAGPGPAGAASARGPTSPLLRRGGRSLAFGVTTALPAPQSVERTSTRVRSLPRLAGREPPKPPSCTRVFGNAPRRPRTTGRAVCVTKPSGGAALLEGATPPARLTCRPPHPRTSPARCERRREGLLTPRRAKPAFAAHTAKRSQALPRAVMWTPTGIGQRRAPPD